MYPLYTNLIYIFSHAVRWFTTGSCASWSAPIRPSWRAMCMACSAMRSVSSNIQQALQRHRHHRLRLISNGSGRRAPPVASSILSSNVSIIIISSISIDWSTERQVDNFRGTSCRALRRGVTFEGSRKPPILHSSSHPAPQKNVPLTVLVVKQPSQPLCPTPTPTQTLNRIEIEIGIQQTSHAAGGLQIKQQQSLYLL